MTADPSARPFLFLRVAFDVEDPSRGWERGDMGTWVRSVFAEEKAYIFDEITTEQAKEVPSAKRLADLQRDARWSIAILAEIDQDMLMPAGPRRFRLYRGGQGDWVQSVLRDAQADLYDTLGDLRSDGAPETDPKVVEARRQLQWSVQLLRDVDGCLISLVGPDEDPRG